MAAKPITLPKSAREVCRFYNPMKKGDNLLLVVKATKARLYVWQEGVWSIRTDEETEWLISQAEEKERRLTAAAALKWRAQNFIDRCRSWRERKAAVAMRNALLASIEEVYLRKVIKAKNVEDKVRILDEKYKLEERIFEAIRIFEDDDNGYEEEYGSHFKFEEPEIPDDWIVIPANPGHNQLELTL
jgi:hypothetical protein